MGSENYGLVHNVTSTIIGDVIYFNVIVFHCLFLYKSSRKSPVRKIVLMQFLTDLEIHTGLVKTIGNLIFSLTALWIILTLY